MRYVNLTVSFFFIIIQCSCSLLYNSPEESEHPADSKVSTQSIPLVGVREPNSPFTFAIEKVLNDGQQIHVFTRITSEKEFDPAVTAIQLHGLAQGAVVREVGSPINECIIDAVTGQPIRLAQNQIAPVLIKAGDSILCYLTLEVSSVSDLQVELLWGQDAKAALENYWSQPLRALEITDIATKAISKAQCRDCPLQVSLEAQLKNKSSQKIEHAVLRLEGVEQNGINLELSKLNLASGNQRAIRMLFDEADFRKRFGIQDSVPLDQVRAKGSIKSVSFGERP